MLSAIFSLVAICVLACVFIVLIVLLCSRGTDKRRPQKRGVMRASWIHIFQKTLEMLLTQFFSFIH